MATVRIFSVVHYVLIPQAKVKWENNAIVCSRLRSALCRAVTAGRLDPGYVLNVV